MKKIQTFIASGAIAMLCVACAGRTPHPITPYQPHDAQMKCQSLRIEMNNLQEQIHQKISKSEKATQNNILFGIGGLFFFPLWFFMDFSNADGVEAEALQTRYRHLGNLSEQKRCGQA
jgi:hypothetical protein